MLLGGRHRAVSYQLNLFPFPIFRLNKSDSQFNPASFVATDEIAEDVLFTIEGLACCTGEALVAQAPFVIVSYPGRLVFPVTARGNPLGSPHSHPVGMLDTLDAFCGKGIRILIQNSCFGRNPLVRSEVRL